MENLMQITSVPAIVAIVYALIEAYKIIINGKANGMRFIPIIAGGLGSVIGVLVYFFAPNLIIATDIFTAIVVGLVSGLSATGANQIFKQLNKKIE
ncbi:MAG: phage holin family protein [Clostridia bacterium]